MMTKDFAFLFYANKVAADVSLMNRLERGCYFDLMRAQCRFGRLKFEQIQSILDKDFEKCWPALQMIMEKTEDSYHINWLEKTLERRESYSKSRSENSQSKKPSVSTTPDFQADAQHTPIIPKMADVWQSINPGYPKVLTDDSPALLDFAMFISDQIKITFNVTQHDVQLKILDKWKPMCQVIMNHPAWKSKSLQTLAKFNKQEIYTQIGDIIRQTEKRMII